MAGARVAYRRARAGHDLTPGCLLVLSLQKTVEKPFVPRVPSRAQSPPSGAANVYPRSLLLYVVRTLRRAGAPGLALYNEPGVPRGVCTRCSTRAL